ncbi:response regulator [Ensifer sp. ENS09]|uniref:response regulator n=1 Tax=Ensifer sp. ENS09 TaxID=2769263 RepID=UPI00177B29D9|nr:response regulator [Ensifer sp. ENS09]MBD9652929.1 response regulator [Ensifer sp. ENS09]
MSDGENTSVNEVATKKKAWPAAHDEMQSLIDDFDWSPTPLGPMENWSPTLKIMVPFLLRNRFPLLLWWGPQYVSIYNEAYRPVLGAKHPWALGKPVSECWSEIWHVLKPLIDTPFNGGPATWNDDIELEINRHGFLEETHFTIAYSPVPDETAANGIGGVLATVTEISEKVIGERRIVVLRDLASRSGDARTPDEACAIATETFKKHERDVPFALLYLVEPGRKRARLSGLAGLKPNQALCPAKVELAQQDSSAGWHFGAELNPILVDDLGRRFPPSASKNHPNLPHTAVVLPLPAANARDAAGFLVVGINPRLKLDEHYHDFLHLMRAQMASAITNAQSYEDERKRSEALAEIDKAKTVFFSNVSHEFRTPITLMLGHIEDLLARSGERPDDRDRLLIAHRNSLRLLKLVNTLLEFSRIEAGRLQARFEPTNLATATAELASAFRSAMEMAGLNLTVDTPPLPEPAYVDRQMWEKIVLNLLSNAFKFTLKGDVAVKLAAGDDNFVLTVRDTGIGIPANEMPRLFERFHRVEGARGRSQEGSGIGLALVQELVKLHGGTVSAESHLDEGTTIRVTIPKGSRAPAIHRNGEGNGHGNGEDRSSTTIGAVPFVEEALQWLPDHPSSDAGLPEVEPAPHPAQTRNGGRRTLLVVDDNADMRDYLRRLLGAQYDLKIVGNGEDALAAVASQKPNLIVTDIMMPGFDGIELLRRLRADTRTNTVPVILLSARAGEESRIEGMQAGADDYLIKPFSARELLARIEAHLKISQYRTEVAETLRASEERFRALVTASSDVVYRMGPDWREMRFLQGKDFVADTDEPSDSWLETYIPAEDQTLMLARISDAIDSKAVFEMEHRVIRRDGSIGWTHSRAIPMLDGKGDIAEWFGAARDITDRKRAEETQQRLLSELSHRVKNMLASVQAIAQHTLRSAKDPADFAASFSGRLQSMSRMHSLLTRTAWEGADLDDIIRDQLLWGTADERRVKISGPPVRFDAQTATHMAMVLHELGTNAAKHGALSLNKGTVSIDWSVTGGALCLNWTERGGPPLKAPLGRGFGTRLIEKVATGGGGSARLTTEADGMRWQVRLPLEADVPLSAKPDAEEPLPAGPAAGAEAAPTKLKGKRILVVEDEALIAFEIAAILEEEDAEVAGPAATPGDALRLIDEMALDAALLDANLRGQPVDAIAAALTDKKVPFVFVSGYGREALPPGFADTALLAKPFNPRQLLEAAALLVAEPKSILRFRH